MTFAWSYNEQRTKKYIFSREPVVFGPVGVFFIKSKFPKGIHFSEYKDLIDYTVLAQRPSWYESDFKKFGVRTIWMAPDANRWKMLLVGRGGGEALLADVYEGLYSIQKQTQLSDASKQSIGYTVQSNVEESEFHGFLMFSKPHFDKRRQLIRDAMDKALKELDIMAAVGKSLDEHYSGDTHQVQ